MTGTAESAVKTALQESHNRGQIAVTVRESGAERANKKAGTGPAFNSYSRVRADQYFDQYLATTGPPQR
jgi:hypothetical protein